MLKFADDTNVLRKILSDADRQQLQDDLNKLTEWCEKWQMLFSYGKCKCRHSGHGNAYADMKVSEQYGYAAATGNQMFELIRRNIVYKEKEVIISLYKTIVRPH